MGFIKKVNIVGGGTAGLTTALILKSIHPKLKVQIIKSNKEKIVGVGEGSTPEWHEFLKIANIKNIVLDPVMVAKGGAKLIDDNAIKMLKDRLIKRVMLITPNIPEAEILTNTFIRSKEDMIFAAHKLIEMGASNVLIKGGHLTSKIVQDIFVSKSDIKIFNNKRYKTKNTHGTGCTLSSAITTFLSCGKPIKKSCELGINYVNSGIRTNPKYGKGHGPINHLNSINLERKFR